MIRKSFNGDIPPIDPDYPLNNPDIDAFGGKYASLFDMDLDKGLEVTFFSDRPIQRIRSPGGYKSQRQNSS